MGGNGMLAYGIDAVATTDDVVIYALPRAELNKLRGSKNAKVHSMALQRARAQHRNSHMKGMPRAQEQMRQIMASPTNDLPEEDEEDLGWDASCSRLPRISKGGRPAGGSSPMLGSGTQPLPQLR